MAFAPSSWRWAAAICSTNEIWRVHTAVQDALHAHVLLRRDVDYVVKNGAIEMVDEFKGRIAQDRRWPAGLHTAIEAKEGVAVPSAQGMMLGSITLQNLVALYPAGLRHDRHRGHAVARVPEGSTDWRWRRFRPTGP